MGFWIFMLIMDLLIPLTMIGFGRYFIKKAPKEINGVFGYRTSMSMKNKDAVETGGAIMMGVQIVPLIGSIFPTEIALSKNFDKNGKRR